MGDPEETSSFLNESAELETIGGNNTADSGKDIRTELVCVRIMIFEISSSHWESIIVKKGSSHCRVMMINL